MRPRESTVRRLYALSMNRCAYPGCPNQLVTAETGSIVGEVCHIRAQNVGGPRYSESQNDEERHGFDNLILMCGIHHKEIDTTANLSKYTVEWLLDIKRTHEDEGRRSEPLEASTTVIAALMWSVDVYEAGSTHMDFRNATFKVGGEGGGPSGGGGSGGVLTIVGIARLPPAIEDEMIIELDGGNGQFPGGGSGGGGVLVYEGRPTTAADTAIGLSVPLFFPANGIQVADGLLFVLGAGWDHMWVEAFPYRPQINVAYTVQFGSIMPNTLLSFDVMVTNETGVECGRVAVNIEVPKPRGPINRNSGVAGFFYDADAAGLYELSMHSGGTCFARHAFEVRLR